MKIKEFKSITFLEPVIKSYPNAMVLVDSGEKGLVEIKTLGKYPAKHIHRDFRVREVALMKGFNGEYDEQELKLNSGKIHDYVFWMYKHETERYRKEQIIRVEKAVIF